VKAAEYWHAKAVNRERVLHLHHTPWRGPRQYRTPCCAMLKVSRSISLSKMEPLRVVRVCGAGIRSVVQSALQQMLELVARGLPAPAGQAGRISTRARSCGAGGSARGQPARCGTRADCASLPKRCSRATATSGLCSLAPMPTKPVFREAASRGRCSGRSGRHSTHMQGSRQPAGKWLTQQRVAALTSPHRM
jgi:hypothetical protein